MISRNNFPGKKQLSLNLVILSITWLIVQSTLIYRYGIVTKLEADTYLTVARQLIDTGHYPSGNFLFYSVQIWLDAFCIKTGTGFWFIILLQLVLNALSTALFYKLVARFPGSQKTAFAATMLLVTMYYYQLYNTHLYTESIYLSLTIILAYLLFTLPSLRIRFLLPVVFVLLLICITRPTGIFFLPATYLFIIFKFFRKKAWLIVGISSILAAVAFYFVLNFVIGSGGALDFLLPYLDERVICGVPTISPAHDIQVPGNKNSVEGIWYIISHYPALFFSLASRRLTAFFGMYRSHYSMLHNLYVCGFFYSCYLLIILSVKKLFRQWLAETFFMLTVIILFTITVMLSCDEWHNRFIFGIMPFFMLMASVFFNKDSKTTHT